MFQGPFTARITNPLLVVSQVGCMPETTAITRRDFRGFDAVPTPKYVAPAPPPARPARRDARLLNRQSGSSPSNNSIPQLTGEAATLVRQLVTAEYSIALINTPGLNL